MSDPKVLVDSHIFIWMLYEPERLSPKATQALQSAGIVYVSMISLWELTLKHALDKLAYSPTELTQGVAALNIERLSLQDKHLHLLPAIRLAHKDPFDRLLLAQSQSEGCVFVTADQQLLRSNYDTIW
jgi:PIN domain nuclease of toxin-antitoxin system